jgi:hypothetical protein
VTLRVAAAAWAVLLLAVAGRVAVAPGNVHTIVPIYLTAAERFEKTESVYQKAPGLDVYRNPPGFAAAFVPFSWLPGKVAGILWRLLGAGLFLYGLLRLSRDVLHLDGRGLAWFLLLPMPLALSSLDNGQANLHIAGLVTLGFTAVGRNRLTAAAGWLGLAVGVKLYPFAAGMLAGVVRPRLLPRLAAGAVLVVAFPFVIANAEYVIGQFREMAESTAADDRHLSEFHSRAPRDWTIITRSWLGWVPGSTVARGVSAVAGLAFAAVVWRTRRLLTAFALGSVWMTLFGPATESQTYTLVAPALATTILTARGWAKALAVAAWWLFTLQVVRDAFPQGWHLAVLGPQPMGAAILMVSTLVDAIGIDGKASSSIGRWLNQRIPTGRIAT